MLIYVEREEAKGLSGHASGHKHVHTERRERERVRERKGMTKRELRRGEDREVLADVGDVGRIRKRRHVVGIRRG